MEPEVYTTKEMCFYCFDVLQYELATRSSTKEKVSATKKTKKPLLEEPRPEDYSLPNFECPLFVGWKKQGRNGGSDHLKLRGCKGTHGSLPLHDGLRQYTGYSAFEDSRFSPIREEEVSRLYCSVSLSCSDSKKWPNVMTGRWESTVFV